MHGVTSDSGNHNSVDLGPVVYAEVKFEGHPVQALIDTGSPATIVSLKFAMEGNGEPTCTCVDFCSLNEVGVRCMSHLYRVVMFYSMLFIV